MPTKASTPKKPLTKSTKSKSTKPKSRIAGLSALNKKRKFNWKIAIIIVVVLAVALGYLFVRLSQAGSVGIIPVSVIDTTDGARHDHKFNGQEVIYGAGVAQAVLAQGGVNKQAYPYSNIVYEVAIFDGNGDGKVGVGGMYLRLYCGYSNKVLYSQSIGEKQGAHTFQMNVMSSEVVSKCTGTNYVRLEVGMGPEDYITGIKFDSNKLNPAPPAPAGLPANDASLGAPSTPSPAPAPPASNLPDCANMNNGIGNQNACVSLIQIKLRQLGYTIDVDGIYGKNTSDNIKVFQQKTGLPQDGITGPRTWARLVQANSCSDPAAKQGCTL
jgi:hypothetical protein